MGHQWPHWSSRWQKYIWYLERRQRINKKLHTTQKEICTLNIYYLKVNVKKCHDIETIFILIDTEAATGGVL